MSDVVDGVEDRKSNFEMERSFCDKEETAVGWPEPRNLKAGVGERSSLEHFTAGLVAREPNVPTNEIKALQAILRPSCSFDATIVLTLSKFASY